MTEKECRICLEKINKNEKFINPCLCSGTSKWVHESCLNYWRELNTDKEAFTKCMECKYIYKFKYIEKKEDYKINLKNKNLIGYFFLIYTLSLPISLLLNYFDEINNYKSIKMLTYNNTEIINKLIENSFEDSNIFFFSYYNYLTMVVYTNIFSICFIGYSLKKIKRKYLYLKLNKNFYIINFVFTNHFLLSLYLFLNWDIYYTYILIELISIFFMLILNLKMVYKNNKVVKEMNTKYNNQILLNYVNEPIDLDELIDISMKDNIYESDYESDYETIYESIEIEKSYDIDEYSEEIGLLK